MLPNEVIVAQAQELLELLACPKCHAGLKSVGSHTTEQPAALRGAPDGFVCEGCKLFFALDDGLPNMLIAEARSWPLGDARRDGSAAV